MKNWILAAVATLAIITGALVVVYRGHQQPSITSDDSGLDSADRSRLYSAYDSAYAAKVDAESTLNGYISIQKDLVKKHGLPDGSVYDVQWGNCKPQANGQALCEHTVAKKIAATPAVPAATPAAKP